MQNIVTFFTSELNKSSREKFLLNLLKFSAPMLALFFLQLANGVSLEKAIGVALIALYGALADLFTKIGTNKSRK